MFGGQGTSGFNFSTPASSTATGTTGFSFGTSANTTANAAAPTTGFSFGGATTAAPATSNAAAGGTTGFSFGASAPAAGGLGTATGFSGFGGLGGATTMPAPTAATTGGVAGFSFGAAASKGPAPAASTGVVAPTGFGATTAAAAPKPAAAATGFSLGGTAAGFGNLSANAKTTAASTTATGLAGFGVTAASKPSGGLLGGLLGASTATTAPTLGTATTLASAAPTGFSLAASTANTSSAATTGFSFGSGLGQPAATSAAPSLGGGLGLGTATTASSIVTLAAGTTAVAGQKQMTFRQLEDTINKWTTELEEQEKSFLDQATQVNAWDRIVMENGEKIIQLNKDLERVKLDQQKLDHELDFVHSQQKELEELVTPLETALNQLPPISHTQHAQLEREHTYTLAESLDSQLKRMSQDLKEIVERLNSSNVKADDNDPLQQMTKILNSHVVSLMWVERNSTNLQRRAEEIAKLMDLEKKEQERNFRMAYS